MFFSSGSDIKAAQLTACELCFSSFLRSHLHKLCVLPLSMQIDEQLVQSSGKFLILDCLLPALKERGHKVTQHSQPKV